LWALGVDGAQLFFANRIREWIQAAESIQLGVFPSSIALGEEEPVIDSKGEGVDESRQPALLTVLLHALPETSPRLTHHEDTGQL
jgi:hypothetical protein